MHGPNCRNHSLPQYSVKQSGSQAPPHQYLNCLYSIMQTLVCCFCRIGHHCHWIQRPDISLALSLNISLASIREVWKIQQPEYTVLSSLSIHSHAYWKCICLPILDTQQWSQWCLSTSEEVIPLYAHIAKCTHTSHEGKNGALKFWAQDLSLLPEHIIIIAVYTLHTCIHNTHSLLPPLVVTTFVLGLVVALLSPPLASSSHDMTP